MPQQQQSKAAPIAWVVLLACLCPPALAPAREQAKKPRPERWAEPVAMRGVPNLHKVSEQLYRGAQPSKVGMSNLEKHGVETIVNLRSFHSDRSRIAGTGLGYEHIYMKAWHPEEKEIVRFLRIVTNPKRTPVLVHCQHGADRTGTMCALYRVIVQGWDVDEAIDEMKRGGFGFHVVWVNLEPWVRGLDFAEIKRRAGLAERARKAGSPAVENVVLGREQFPGSWMIAQAHHQLLHAESFRDLQFEEDET